MTSSANQQLKTAALTKWQQLNRRDKVVVCSAVSAFVLMFVWWALVATPLQVLRQADKQQRNLDMQLQAVQSLQAQAESLKAQPTMKREAALAMLQSSVKRYDAFSQLDVVGERVTVTLRALPADELAKWFALARTSARALPIEARLIRSPGAIPSWDGILVLSLPAQ